MSQISIDMRARRHSTTLLCRRRASLPRQRILFPDGKRHTVPNVHLGPARDPHRGTSCRWAAGRLQRRLKASHVECSLTARPHCFLYHLKPLWPVLLRRCLLYAHAASNQLNVENYILFVTALSSSGLHAARCVGHDGPLSRFTDNILLVANMITAPPHRQASSSRFACRGSFALRSTKQLPTGKPQKAGWINRRLNAP